MSALVAFLYGWLAGIVAIVLCILYGFDTILFLMRLPGWLLRRTSLSHGSAVDPLSAAATAIQMGGLQTYKAARSRRGSMEGERLEGIVSGSLNTASPLKMSATCLTSWHEDGGRSGPPLWCRFVLEGHILTVYEILPSAGAAARNWAAEDPSYLQDHDTNAAEHLRGRTSVYRLAAALVKKAPKDKTRPNSPFFGRLLLLSTTDGLPLVGQGDEAITADPDGSPRSSTASPVGAKTSPSLSPSRGSVGGLSFPGTSASVVSGVNAATQRRGMAAWSRSVVRFHNARETERWSNVLAGYAQAAAYRQFAMTVPNPDTTNLLLSRFFFQHLFSEGLANAIKKQIQKKLKKISVTKFPRDMGGEIVLDDFVIGTHIPWVTEVSDPAVSMSGEVGFDFNLHYKGGDDGFTLFFRLALTYRDVRVPHVVFSVKLRELEATIHVSVGPPPSKKFWIAGHKPPVLRLEVHQGCASGHGLLHRILTSLPDLSGIVTNLIKLYLISDIVLPYMDDFPLPNFDDTPKNSRAASPKSRTFDRKRAAAKSAAPDGAAAPTDPLTASPGTAPPDAARGPVPPLSLPTARARAAPANYELPAAFSGAAPPGSEIGSAGSSPWPPAGAQPLPSPSPGASRGPALPVWGSTRRSGRAAGGGPGLTPRGCGGNRSSSPGAGVDASSYYASEHTRGCGWCDNRRRHGVRRRRGVDDDGRRGAGGEAPPRPVARGEDTIDAEV